MTLDKALVRALNTEAVKRIEEEDNEPRVSAIHSNEYSQLYNSTKDLVRPLQTIQSIEQDNQNLSAQAARLEEFLCGC